LATDSISDRRILDGPVIPVLFSVAIPLMINNLINSIYNLADGLWVAQLSMVEFAATSFVWPPHYLFVALGVGVAIAGTTIISQLIGSEDKLRAESYASHIFYFCLILGVTFSIVGYLLAPSIVGWMGGTGELGHHASIYLGILMAGFVFEMLYLTFFAILGAQGKTKVTTIISACAAGLNAILDPFFIFERVPVIGSRGLGMGIAGAALATVLSQVVRVILGAYVIYSPTNEIRLRIRKVKLTWLQFKELIRMGFPTAFGQASAALGFTMLNAEIAAYGDATIAAYAAVNRIGSFVMQPTAGIGGSLTAIVGQNMGAGKPERVRQFNRAAFRIITLFAVVGSLLLWFVRFPILSLFITEQGSQADLVWKLAIEYTIFNVFMTPMMGYFDAYSGIFSGAGYPRYAAYMSILRLWGFRLPLIWAFRKFTSLGPLGVWISLLASNVLIIFYAAYLYWRGKWIERPQLEH
jgi:putative MATE family efflux protein